MPQTLDYVRPRFEEVQKANFAAGWHLFFAATGLLGFVLMMFHWTPNIALEDVSGLILLAGASGFVIVLVFASMRTRVDGEGVHIKFGPMPWKTFDAGQIEGAAACTYDAKKEFGGWGMQVRLKGQDDSYTLGGHRGVRIALRNAKPVLIGSERAEELAAAIQQLIAASPKSPEESRSS